MSRKLAKSFHFAISGIFYALKTQRNFRIQIVIGAASLILGLLLRFDRIEFAVLLITIGFVLSSELVNTILEAVVDLATDNKVGEKAKFAKDVSASVVLLNAVISVLVGLFLFLPHILALL